MARKGRKQASITTKISRGAHARGGAVDPAKLQLDPAFRVPWEVQPSIPHCMTHIGSK
jgi:hypothetical protein